jgi:PPOX class probable F420-dependent enzyme
MVLTDESRRFLSDHRVARLATASGDGQPHVIPLCYALLDDLIYFVVDEKPKRTHQGLRRLQNIRCNPQVALVVDDYDDDWTQLAYLLVQGQAAIVDDADEFERALNKLRARYSQYSSMPLDFERNPMVSIRPASIRLWRAR